MNFSKKSINIDLSIVKNNPSVIFSVLLILLFILECLVIKNSLSLLSNSNAPALVTPSDQGVRINFDAYNQIVQRIEQAKSFQPSGEPILNPFAGTVTSGSGN